MMKKLLFLVFPLAFLIGFMPFFFNLDEIQTTSIAPQITEETEKEEENIMLIQEEIEDEITYNVELLRFNVGIIENATVLTNDGIENI